MFDQNARRTGAAGFMARALGTLGAVTLLLTATGWGVFASDTGRAAVNPMDYMAATVGTVRPPPASAPPDIQSLINQNNEDLQSLIDQNNAKPITTGVQRFTVSAPGQATVELDGKQYDSDLINDPNLKISYGNGRDTQNYVQTVLANEHVEYDGHSYQLLDPASIPTRLQDCAGYVFQQLWPQTDPETRKPIPYVMGAKEFYEKMILGTNAPAVADGNEQFHDVVVFFDKDGNAAHIAIVSDVKSAFYPVVTIQSKDQWERVYTGPLGSYSDPLLTKYPGGVRVFRVNPTVVQVTKKN
jgi:hypothetical protein